MRRVLGQIGALVVGLGAAAPLIACYYPEVESRRFSAYRPDFLRMPQPWRAAPAEDRARGGNWWTSGRDPEGARKAAAAREALVLEAGNRFPEAARAWERYQMVVEKERRERWDE